LKNFEKLYLEVRKAENRIYHDDEVKLLPYASSTNPHYAEWNLRAISLQRVLKFLKTKTNYLKILDLGCGNGWFSSRLAALPNLEAYGLDVNYYELIQAANIFHQPNLKFFYGDIFEDIFTYGIFDIIFLNSTIQYFSDLKALIIRLNDFLNNKGEIHILDSPLYTVDSIDQAKKRSFNYYQSIGYSEMTNHYFHHSYNELQNFKYDVLFNPNKVISTLKILIRIKDSPFPWIRIMR
ncbi:MAG: class I SAM-dependent methyltransferase, partial [Ignavibacteria bacterium]|nr:class I SAM-dependent methyltransferase [Ignavibacteria bacterium]